MKIEIAKDKASRMINCGMVVLVSCAYEDKKNITTCAWHMPVSKQPPLITVALAKQHFSSELISKSKEFIVNIPAWRLLDKVVTCGSSSGRGGDKFSLSRLTPEKANILTQAVKIAEAAGALECSLFDTKDAGDHYIFIGEVLYCEAEEGMFGQDFWDTSKIDLIFHLGGRFFCKSQAALEYGK
ncbi:MAG: flavin reductase family protein [Candidatus Omnitrophota bacterium]